MEILVLLLLYYLSQNPEFPERDFHLSVELDSCNFVLRLKKNPDGLDYMERIDII